MNLSANSAAWQCVLICWGTKYPVSIVNRLVRAIAEHSPGVARFTLLTDRDRPGLDPRVTPVRMPDFFCQPALMRAGCQAKLCMFEPGVLPTDLPAIYVDLDTLVFGDLGQALALSGWLEQHPDMHALTTGVWNRKAPQTTVLREADRVEVYRDLRVDPKVARRERFVGQGARGTGLFARRKAGSKAGY